jgi:uncharacterized protein YerC
MPHISKKKLGKKTVGKIFSKLIILLGKARNHREISNILDELFTETEKIMMAKRLALILMLDGNIPHQRIQEVLTMSPSTIARLYFGIERGKYEFIRNIAKKDRVDLEKIMWLMLTAGGIMPPRGGRKYWRKRGWKAWMET